MTELPATHALGRIDVVTLADAAALSRDVPRDIAAVQAAWPAFEAAFDSLRGRTMMGLVHGDSGVYRMASVRLERDDDTPADMDDTVIPGGDYLRLRLRGSAPGIYARIGPAFEVLFELADHDADRPHIEHYRRAGEVDCLVPIRSAGQPASRTSSGARTSSCRGMDRARTLVEVVPSDPAWVGRFLVTAGELQPLFPGSRIEHVGSTSVPGLPSKDTVDVAVGVRDVGLALDAPTLLALAERGFEHVPASFADDPGHAFLHRIVDGHRTDHVHVVASASEAMSGYLLFRDFLRATPEAAHRYATAKRALAHRFASRRDDYVVQKRSVVDALMDEARAWARDVERHRGPDEA